MKLKKFFEFDKFEPLKSFYIKDTLNPDVWNEKQEMDSKVREELLEIANDYIEFCDLTDFEISDIVLTGSMAFYNYSSYSDFDVHIILDFNVVDNNTELVKKFLDSCKKLWGFEHNIKIKGYEVELYCQDISEEHTAQGQFSLLNNEWIKVPIKEDFEPDEDLIKSKATTIIDKIDDIEEDFKSGVDYDIIKEKIKKVWSKLKDGRKAGLEESGEYSIENLIFKLLRRNGYTEKIFDIRRKAYDKQFK
jgi:hypothetical protein